MAEHLKVSGLALVDGKGKTVLTLDTADGGGGLWITGPDGSQVAVYSINGQTGVGIYSKESIQHAGRAMPICLTVDENGDGCIQFCLGDEILTLTAADVKRLHKP